LTVASEIFESRTTPACEGIIQWRFAGSITEVTNDNNSGVCRLRILDCVIATPPHGGRARKKLLKLSECPVERKGQTRELYTTTTAYIEAMRDYGAEACGPLPFRAPQAEGENCDAGENPIVCGVRTGNAPPTGVKRRANICAAATGKSHATDDQ